jgi:DNA-binding NtrC family response regulator
MSAPHTLKPEQPILFVDDEAQFLESASFTMRSAGLNNFLTCQDSRTVMELLEGRPVSLVVLDMMMPHVSGRELLVAIRERHPGVPVIILTAVNEVSVAVECMKHGACDYLLKPVDKERLIAAVGKILECRAIADENNALRESLLCGQVRNPQLFEEIVTGHSAMLAAFRYVEAVSTTSLPLLVTGETGCGKELFARAFHRTTGRAGGFVTVNVAGLDDAMFSDTLFGHEKGAFTGALGKREGLIAQAAGGTLFLDEIGDLKQESQVKLLRLIDDRTYYPLGSDRPRATDVRIVVATNHDLFADQNTGSFRRDLFYRLQSHHVRLPPLRERRGDIPLLLDHFLEQAAAEMHIEVPTVPPQLYILLETYGFPGNVRELRGMVFDALSRHVKGILSMESFKEHLFRAGGPPAAQTAAEHGAKVIFTDTLPTLREVDELLVREALNRSQQNQSIASRMLGITRTSLNKRINHPYEPLSGPEALS